MKSFFWIYLSFFISTAHASVVTLAPGQTTQVGDVTVTCGTSAAATANPKFPAAKAQTCSGSFSMDPAVRACQGSPEGAACNFGGKNGYCYGTVGKDKKDFNCRCQ